MRGTVLPDDLKLKTASDVQLYNYRRTQDIVKTKINLSMHTISFLRRGTKEVMGDDEAVSINNKNFVIMKSGNCLMTENVAASYKLYHSVLLFFSNKAVLNFLEKYKGYTSPSEARRSFYVCEYDTFIESYVLSLEHIASFAKGMQEQMLSSKFEELMLYLTDKLGWDFLNTIVDLDDDKGSQLNAVVENNRLNRLSLDELAFLANMSISTFKREFSKLYETTPMKWFAQQRMNHAAFLLETGSKRPIELYEDAGYENLSNFVHAFKKLYGMTPKQYQMQG